LLNSHKEFSTSEWVFSNFQFPVFFSIWVSFFYFLLLKNYCFKRLFLKCQDFFALFWLTLLYMVCCVFQATNLVNNYGQRKSARTFASRQEASNKLYTVLPPVFSFISLIFRI
jgi:fatty-acid desaturase